MMKALLLVLCVLFFIISCTELPRVRPADDPAALASYAGCEIPFPKGKWQFVHSIEAELPGGRKGLVIGVTVISSDPRSIACVIMSLEGFVLFDARQEQDLVIKRAIAPFEKKAFAEGLMKDIQLIFFKPDGQLIGSGVLENGSPLCRYQISDGRIVDIVTNSDNTWEIRQYNKDLRLTRTVKAWPPDDAGSVDNRHIPGRLELKTHGFHGYRLAMTLVDAVPLSQ